MRYMYLLLILVLVSSCAHNRLRLRKVDKRDRTEIVQNDAKPLRDHKKQTKPEVIPVTTESKESIAIIPETKEEPVSEELSVTEDVEVQEHTSRIEKATDEIEDDPMDAVKVDEALHAEKLAKRAKNSFIASFIVMFIPFISIASLALFLVGSILLAISNRSNYITPLGQRYARIARIMQIVYLVLLAIGVAILLAFIFL